VPFIHATSFSVSEFKGGECTSARLGGVSPVIGLILGVGGLLVTIASFYLIMKMAGLVDALSQKIKEMKL
jgi:hypothetical protein